MPFIIIGIVIVLAIVIWHYDTDGVTPVKW